MIQTDIIRARGFGFAEQWRKGKLFAIHKFLNAITIEGKNEVGSNLLGVTPWNIFTAFCIELLDII